MGGLRQGPDAIRMQEKMERKHSLKECPPALSLGIQVSEHQNPWVWFPGQLPFFIKADRVQDVTFHCPESAKIYVDRVVQIVPILHETLSCDVGTNPVHQGNSTVPSVTCETSSLSSWTRKERGAKRFRTTAIGGPPWN